MADFEVIPQRSIDVLLSNPNTAPQFDGVFGKGRAAEVLAAQDPQPAPVEDEDDTWSYMGEATRAIVGGVRDAVHETANFAQWVDTAVNERVFGEGKVLSIGTDGISVQDRADAPFMFGDDSVLPTPEVAPNKTMVGGFGRGITQFITGYATFSKLTKLQGLKGAFVNGALADAIVFNPDDPNITKMLEEFDIDTGKFGEALATDPDDPEWANRLRNAAEGVLAGGVVEAIGWGVKAARAKKRGDVKAVAHAMKKQEEALKALDDAITENGGAVKADIDETVAVERDLFADMLPPKADAEGNLEMDLGDTPLPADPVRPKDVAPSKDRIFMTPEKAEKIRLQASLARGASQSEKMAALSFRSPRTADTVDDIADELAGYSAVLTDEYSKLKGGDVQRWKSVRLQSAAQLRQMIKMGGEAPNALIERFRTANAGDMPRLAAEIHTQSTYLIARELEMKKMSAILQNALENKPYDLKEFPDIRDLDHLRVALMYSKEVYANLLGGHDAARSNLARAMHAMKMAKKGDEALRQLMRNGERFDDADTLARALLDPKNAEEPTLSLIDRTLKSTKELGDVINTFRINALLSGPGTQEVNFVSNAIQALVIPLDQALGGAVSGDAKMVGHAVRQLQGTFAAFLDFQEVWSTVGKAGWDNKPILDPGYLKTEEAAFSTATTLAGKIVTTPSRFLMTMDELFKQSQYRGRVFADGNAEAVEKGLIGQARMDYIQKYVKESFTDEGVYTRDDAMRQARRATFTEPLEPGSYGSQVQAMAVKSPVTRFFIPFVRTPVNILSQTFQHTPLIGLASKRMRDDLAAGGVRAAQARGRQALGTMLVATAGYLAANDRITGAGPSDPRIRKVWLKNNQPYSFRVRNEDGTSEYVSFARLEPLSNVFSIAADLVEIMRDEYNESERVPMMQAFGIAVMENTINKTFTQGIADAMKLFVGRPHEQNVAARNFVASFVPNALNQTNGDDVMREVRTVMDAILSRTHLYNQVDPKRNVLGEPVLRTLPKYDPLGITEADIRETDGVLEEVTKMAILNQTVADNPARRLAGPNRIDLSTVPYSETQSVYDRWLELTGTVKLRGRTLRQELTRLIETDAYKRAPEGTIGVTEKTKGAMIRGTIEAYRQKAKGELPELRELIKAERVGTGNLLKEQARRNREFLPQVSPFQATKKRSFEDLLK